MRKSPGCRRPAPVRHCPRAPTASASAGSTPRRRCSGPLLVFRWHGVSGRRWKAPSRFSDREDKSLDREKQCSFSRAELSFGSARHLDKLGIDIDGEKLNGMKRVPNASGQARRERLGTERHLRPIWPCRKRPSGPNLWGWISAAAFLNPYWNARILLASGIPEIRVRLNQG